MGSRVTHVLGFLPTNFQFPIHPSIVDLGSGTGQTGGQTTAIVPPPYGSGGIKIIQFCKTDQSRIWPDSGYPAGSG